MTTFLGRRIISAALAAVVMLSGPLGIVATAAARPAVALRASRDVSRPSVAVPATLHAREALAKLPFAFEVNQGQTDPRVDFLARGAGYTLFLTATEAVLLSRDVLRMKLGGGNPDAEAVGVDPLPGKTSYFVGSDPARRRTNVPTYGKVKYRDVYPGIDIVYYGNQRHLEHDFLVAPGADPRAIRLAFDAPPRIDASGDLILGGATGDVRLRKPFIYQDIDGVRHPVAGGYVLPGPPSATPATHEVGFQVAAYDVTKPLVIDPVLFYSTYLGGSQVDGANGIAVDAQGHAYIVGNTLSPDFPGAGTSPAGSQDVFVTKLEFDPATFTFSVAYSTYFGGADTDAGNAIVVDAAGNAYVTGSTTSDAVSDGFPVSASAFDTACGTDGLCDADDRDAFVAKFDASGALVYATYLGGHEWDVGYAIAVDALGTVYVTGGTSSNAGDALFPVTAGAFSITDPHVDVFMTKLKLDGTNAPASCTIKTLSYNDCDDLLYSTYLNHRNDDDAGMAIAVDAAFDVYVAGWTGGANPAFPTKNAFQTATNGGKDLFLMKIRPDDSNENVPCSANTPYTYNDCADLLYSTYFGTDAQDTDAGDGGDDGARDIAIAVHGARYAYLTGRTQSVGFPVTAGAFDTSCGTDGTCNEDPITVVTFTDAFVAKFDTAASGTASLVYATYLGGSGHDRGLGIAVDNDGNAYVTGTTTSLDFPAPGTAAAPKFGAGLSGQGTDVFVAKLSAAGDALLYAAYVGGTGVDIARGIALDPSCNAYLAGETSSVNHPLLNPLPPNPGAGINVGLNGDAFVTKVAALGFRAYVPNLDAGSVSAVDTHTHAVATVGLPAGTSNPEGVAVHPDGTRVYVANRGSSSVSVISTATNTEMKAISVGANLNPIGVAITRDGTRVYVANSVPTLNSAGLAEHTISVIDTANDELLPPVTLSVVAQEANVPFGIAVSPDPQGTTVYVTNQVGDFVTVIGVDTTTTPPTHDFVTTIPVGNAPAGIAVHPFGTSVFVANAGSDTVSVIDTATNTNALNIDVGGGTFGVAVHPNGSKVFVTGPGDNLSVLDWKIPPDPVIPVQITKVGVGNLPRGVAVTPDGALVYVANYADNTVSVVNTANNKRLVFTDPVLSMFGDLKVGAGPVALGQFIGFPVLDKDGDGIWDMVDGDPLSTTNATFGNTHLCGTVSGEIIDDGGLGIVIESPAGLVIKTLGASGQAEIKLCDFATKLFPGGVVEPLSCGSLTAYVQSGPFEILLGNAGAATVPSGVKVRVAEIAAGAFEIQNLGGPGTITVTFGGRVSQVTPGGSKAFSGAQVINDACPCAGPSTGGAWKTHGAYVSCIAKEADRSAKSGLITHKDKGAIQSEAAGSSCGVK